MLASKKEGESRFRVDARLAAGICSLPNALDALGFAALNVEHECHNSLVDRQGRHNIVVNSDDHLCVVVAWRQFQHALVIVISPKRVSKRGIPCLLDQTLIDRGEGTCNSSSIKRVDIVGLGSQSIFA